MAKKATVAKASSKKELALGQWVETLKRVEYLKKGTLAWVERLALYSDEGDIVIRSVDKDGFEDYFYCSRKDVKASKAPEYAVTWAYEDEDPTTYARTRAEADKLASRKKVSGKKVIWSRVFKAV